MRNGLRFLRCGVPTDLRTLAPAPSAFSTALKTFAIVRGIMMDSVKVVDSSVGTASAGFLRNEEVLLVVVVAVAEALIGEFVKAELIKDVKSSRKELFRVG